MSSKTATKAKVAGIILTSAVLAGVSTHAVAAAQGPVEKCVVQAVWEAPELASAVNHCYWDHWDGTSEYN